MAAASFAQVRSGAKAGKRVPAPMVAASPTSLSKHGLASCETHYSSSILFWHLSSSSRSALRSLESELEFGILTHENGIAAHREHLTMATKDGSVCHLVLQ